VGLRFKIVPGKTEHITFNGKRIRRPTVLIRVGDRSISKKAFLLGLTLVLVQILDGILTYIGVEIAGFEEGNSVVRRLMDAYGAVPALTLVKFLAILLACLLAFYAHQRKWVRPLIAVTIGIYLALAILPWLYFLS